MRTWYAGIGDTYELKPYYTKFYYDVSIILILSLHYVQELWKALTGQVLSGSICFKHKMQSNPFCWWLASYMCFWVWQTDKTAFNTYGKTDPNDVVNAFHTDVVGYKAQGYFVDQWGKHAHAMLFLGLVIQTLLSLTTIQALLYLWSWLCNDFQHAFNVSLAGGQVTRSLLSTVCLL